MFQTQMRYWHEAMSEFKGGEEIEIRYSDGDYSRLWAVLPDARIVEAELVTPGSILNPNKKTVELVKKAEANERRMAKEWRFIEQSIWRGESTEDRVAQLINPEEIEIPQRIAVNERPAIHNLTRFDKPKLVVRGRNKKFQPHRLRVRKSLTFSASRKEQGSRTNGKTEESAKCIVQSSKFKKIGG